MNVQIGLLLLENILIELLSTKKNDVLYIRAILHHRDDQNSHPSSQKEKRNKIKGYYITGIVLMIMIS